MASSALPRAYPGTLDSSVTLDWTEHFVVAAIASATTKLVIQPLDTAKTLTQCSARTSGLTPAQRKNAILAVSATVRKYGPKSLYRGLPATLVYVTPSTALFFAIFNAIKANAIASGTNAVSATLASAALANVAASAVRVPPEVMKQRVQAGLYPNLAKAAVGMWREDGFSAFYRGYSAQVLRDVPYAAVQFGTYEAVRRWQQRTAASAETSRNPLVRLASRIPSGALGGMAAVVVTSPLDAAKTRIMTSRGVVRGMYRGAGGTLRCLRNMTREDGVGACFRGILPRLAYKMPSSGLFLFLNETGADAVRKIRRLNKRGSVQR
ncbi:mitochondrial carrier protein [Pseudoscourfieldia marina]